MKPPAQPRCYLCQKAPMLRKCGGCGQPVCESDERLGVDGKGNRQWLCLPCDKRRQHQYAVLRARG